LEAYEAFFKADVSESTMRTIRRIRHEEFSPEDMKPAEILDEAVKR
jgi:hypothetical protein